MSEEPSPEDVLRGDAEDEEEQSRDFVPLLQIFDEMRHLNADLGKTLLTIYKAEEVTTKGLAQELDHPESRIQRNVNELRKQGYLGVSYEHDEKRYYVSSDWGTQEFPSGPVIPLVYQYNLLSDQQRMEALYEAVMQTVDKGDVVVDLGAGLGFLSHCAAELAEQVYAVEIDREVCEKGRAIVQREEISNVEYIRGDAREVNIPAEVDVVLCELLDTGLIAELQVPVMNHAIEEFGDDVKTVPVGARTSMRLIEADYEFYGNEFRVPHFEEYGSRESVPRSNESVYHDVDFGEQNSELVEERVTMTANEGGLVNGIQLNTEVQFAPGMSHTGASPWLNPPLNLPFDEGMQLESGDSLTVEVEYELGGGLSNIVYRPIHGN